MDGITGSTNFERLQYDYSFSKSTKEVSSVQGSLSKHANHSVWSTLSVYNLTTPIARVAPPIRQPRTCWARMWVWDMGTLTVKQNSISHVWYVNERMNERVSQRRHHYRIYTVVIKGRQKLVYMLTGHSSLIRKRTIVLLQNMYMYLIQQEIRVFFIKKNCWTFSLERSTKIIDLQRNPVHSNSNRTIIQCSAIIELVTSCIRNVTNRWRFRQSL
jgi:hypothetical protein